MINWTQGSENERSQEHICAINSSALPMHAMINKKKKTIFLH
jgi:hypothetical protein